MAAASLYLTHGPKGSRVDVHDEFCSYAVIDRQRGVDAASAKAQVENLARKKDAIGWEAAERRCAAAIEPRMTETTLGFVSPLSHVKNIVRCARRLENGINVMRIFKPK